MEKIPTLFLRDPSTNLRTLTREIHPGCEWVAAGEGVATRKFDGTCAMIRDGELFKRREVRRGKIRPILFELVSYDPITGKTVGWCPVGNGPEDKWFHEAFADLWPRICDGTYELVGPKIQGNPEKYSKHTLVPHGAQVLEGVPTDWDGLRDWLSECEYEGVVWHHPDGRMAKIKARDF